MASIKSFLAESGRIVLPLLILAAGIGGFLVFGQKQPPPPRNTAKDDTPVVKTVPAGKHDQELVIEVDGIVYPYREITIAAEVAGKIVHKDEDCRAGKYVTQGMKLVEIDDTEYQLQVERLLAEEQRAEKALEEIKEEKISTGKLLELAEDQVDLKKKKLNRVLSLPANAKSATDEDDAQQELLTSRNSWQTLKNQARMLNVRELKLEMDIKVVRAQKKQAELDVKRSTIVAPIDGVITECSVEQGGHIQVGKTLFTMEDTSAVEVKSNLRMEELAWVWKQLPASRQPQNQELPVNAYQLPKTPVEIIYELGDYKFVWKGVLSRYESIGLDEKTRTVPCRVVVDEPCSVVVRPRHGAAAKPTSSYATPDDAGMIVGPRALVRGMFVTTRILTKPRVPLLRIPAGALKPGNIVWRVRGGKIELVEVKVAESLDDQIIIEGESGLAEGDRIVVTPLALVTEGMTVREEK